MALKFYASVTKELKLKIGIFFGVVPTFIKVTREKVVRRVGWGGVAFCNRFRDSFCSISSSLPTTPFCSNYEDFTWFLWFEDVKKYRNVTNIEIVQYGVYPLSWASFGVLASQFLSTGTLIQHVIHVDPLLTT